MPSIIPNGVIFHCKSKKNLQYRFIKWKRELTKNVLADAKIQLLEETTYFL